jgi:DNA-binding MarR family transcriptional regulator
MTILFGTLGWRPQSLIPSIRSTKDIEKLYFYHSDNPETIKARDKVVEHCASIGLPVQPIELPNVFNLIDIAERMKEDIDEVRSEGNSNIRFNIAGGTRLTSSAALLVCILKGIPTMYVHDETFEEIQLPLLRMDYSSNFTAKQKEILNFLRKNKDKPLSQTELAGKIGIHKATMNHHVKELREKGVVLITPGENDSRARMISLAPHVDLLLE